ncbi:MAG: response regulator transcription factor [Anaerolineales bacterium]
MDHIGILIVDDHPMMREALKGSFLGEDDLEVIGEASDPIEAFELLNQITPDVILMDLLMPRMNGVDAVQRIIQSKPQTKIIVVSSMENEENVMAAIQAGALGYFPKTAPREYLLEAIRKVADGIPYMPSGITLKLFQGLRHIKSVPAAEELQITVTTRQWEILNLLAEGKSDGEIAKTLSLQEATVRAHIYHVQQRLGLESRAQVIAYVHGHLSKK